MQQNFLVMFMLKEVVPLILNDDDDDEMKGYGAASLVESDIQWRSQAPALCASKHGDLKKR